MIPVELFYSEVVLQRFSEVTTVGIYTVSSLQSVSNIFSVRTIIIYISQIEKLR